MIRGGFLTEEDRGKLVALVRDGSAAARVTRRANALVLLDGGWSCQEVAAALLMDDDTIRGWHKLFEQRGIEGLTSFDMGGSAGFLSTAQEDALKAHVGATLPRSTRQVGAWIEQEFGLVYESRSAFVVYPDSSKTREKFLVFFGLADSARRMIRGGFLTEEDRGKLVALFGRWIELSGSRRCVGARWLGGVAGDSAGQRLGAVDGRRHDPWLAQTV